MKREDFKRLDSKLKRLIVKTIVEELKNEIFDWHLKNCFEDKGLSLIDRNLELPNELEEGSPQDSYRFEMYFEIEKKVRNKIRAGFMFIGDE